MVTDRSLRIVFFGTPRFAVPSLDRLLQWSRHRVVGVVTQPDRPHGRGQRTTDAPVKVRALQAGLPILQPATLKDSTFASALASLDPDIGIVAAYGKILPDAVISVPRLGMINVHASLLPRYRGAAPVHRAVMAGERETGVTIMRVVKALDAGPTFASTRHPIGETETSEDVERALAEIGASLLVVTLDRIAEGAAEEGPQSDADATYAPRLTKEEGTIDWTRAAREIHNQIRGLHPWPHAYSYLHGRRVILLRSIPTPAPSAGRPGALLTAAGDDVVVATGEGALRILELQTEGKRAMGAREFLAGHHLAAGDRFGPRP